MIWVRVGGSVHLISSGTGEGYPMGIQGRFWFPREGYLRAAEGLGCPLQRSRKKEEELHLPCDGSSDPWLRGESREPRG